MVKSLEFNKAKGRYTGITTFIKQSLLRNVPFSRQNVGARQCAARGLWIGRTTDLALNNHVSGKIPYKPGVPGHGRLGHILRALRGKGIHLLLSQCPVEVDHLGLKTNIDAIGVCGNEVVVVELKTTQHSHGAHLRTLYTKECSRQPILHNGLTNSEKTHHMLQIGFGVHCIASLLRRKARVRGVVVVSYKDTATVLDMDPMYSAVSWFTVHTAAQPAYKAAPKKNKRAAKKHQPVGCVPWPSKDNRVSSLLRRQCINVVHSKACHRTHAVPAVMPGGVDVIMACITHPVHTLSRQQRKHLAGSLLKSTAYIFDHSPKNTTHHQTYVLAPGKNQQWTIVPLC
jgi:hypothetical protein